MDTTTPHNDMRALFAQLGEPNDEQSIRKFIDKHKFRDREMRLYEAGFWSEAQAKFLREAICDDAEWAIVVDELDVALRLNP
jgi:hypothetical protein